MEGFDCHPAEASSLDKKGSGNKGIQEQGVSDMSKAGLGLGKLGR